MIQVEDRYEWVRVHTVSEREDMPRVTHHKRSVFATLVHQPNHTTDEFTRKEN